MRIKVFTTVDRHVVEQIDAVAQEIGGTRADAMRLIISRGLSSSPHPSIDEMLYLILRETVYTDYYLRAICDLKDLTKVPKGRQIRMDADKEFARLLGGSYEAKAE
jgi:Mn-containing catalase